MDQTGLDGNSQGIRYGLLKEPSRNGTLASLLFQAGILLPPSPKTTIRKAQLALYWHLARMIESGFFDQPCGIFAIWYTELTKLLVWVRVLHHTLRRQPCVLLRYYLISIPTQPQHSRPNTNNMPTRLH
jgi:hypothetical protein